MRIAIFDYVVVTTNAIGNCNRTLMSLLADQHEFIVFAATCDNPAPGRITFVPVPAVRRPLFLLFITYHLAALVVYWLYWLRRRVRFDIIQSIESNSLLGKLVYAHFCHRAYLKKHWHATRPSGLRGIARGFDHWLHALLEPLVYRRAKYVVVPSRGLAQELIETFPRALEGKIHIIPNPVDLDRMHRPEDFDRPSKRSSLGISTGDLACVFVALGHFERKGLPILIDAVEQAKDTRIRLTVVGGQPSLIAHYRAIVASKGLENQVLFVGMQQDIRPYLWAADLFVFPSVYEIFPLVALEAAAAGLPLLTAPVYGIEEFVLDGINGWLVERTPEALAEKLHYSLENPAVLYNMGQHAVRSVEQYKPNHFRDHWQAFYATIEKEARHGNS